MRKVTTTTLVIVMLLGVLVALTACGNKNEENSIVGSWKNDDLGFDFIYTFNADGTGDYDAAGNDMPFTYTIDGNKLSILFEAEEGENMTSMDTEFSIDGDILNVKDSTGTDTLYKRTEKVQKESKSTETKKSDEIGTAGSNMPLKDNQEEAEYQIKAAMKKLIEETYGEKVVDSRVYVEKIYTAEDESGIDVLKEMNLGPNEVAFEVKYELKPAEGVDPIVFTAATGDYDEDTGWVIEKYNLGILRPNENGEEGYRITDFGTGW